MQGAVFDSVVVVASVPTVACAGMQTRRTCCTPNSTFLKLLHVHSASRVVALNGVDVAANSQLRRWLTHCGLC